MDSKGTRGWAVSAFGGFTWATERVLDYYGLIPHWLTLTIWGASAEFVWWGLAMRLKPTLRWLVASLILGATALLLGHTLGHEQGKEEMFNTSHSMNSIADFANSVFWKSTMSSTKPAEYGFQFIGRLSRRASAT